MKKVNIYEPYLIDCKQSIYDCMLKFEVNNIRTLLVKNENKIVGSITDGDIRKALIKSRTLHTNINTVMNNDLIFCESESECENLFFRHEYLLLIPMLNYQRELLSIYLRY